MNNAFKKRWKELSLVEQLANIGSEFQRLVSARKLGNIERTNQAMARLLELLDMSIANESKNPTRLNELTRLREIISENDFDPSLQNYFIQYAQAARK